MRTRQLALTSAAIALLASLGVWVSPALAAPSCSSGSTLAISKSARVFQVRDGSIRRLYGCSTSTRKRSYLGRVGGEGVDTSVIAVTGPRVAYVRNSCGEGGCQQSVLIRDLKKRKDLLAAPATPGDVDQKVTDLRLGRFGFVAWIAEENPDAPTARYVFARKLGQPVDLLASGLNIVRGSLALGESNRLYWLAPAAVLVIP